MLSALKATFLSLMMILSHSLLAQTNNFTLADWPATPPALKPMYVNAIMEQAGIHQVTFTREADFYVEQLDAFAQFAQEKKLSSLFKNLCGAKPGHYCSDPL